jgi:hypothetical protein
MVTYPRQAGIIVSDIDAAIPFLWVMEPQLAVRHGELRDGC